MPENHMLINGLTSIPFTGLFLTEKLENMRFMKVITGEQKRSLTRTILSDSGGRAEKKLDRRTILSDSRADDF